MITQLVSLLFLLSNIASAVEMIIDFTIDNSGMLYINGVPHSKTTAWQNQATLYVELAPGDNIIAIQGLNDAGTPGGVLVGWQVPSLGMSGTSDSSWKMSTSVSSGSWTSKSYSIASWQTASVKALYGSGAWGSGVTGWSWPGASWIWDTTSSTSTVYFRTTIHIPTSAPTASPTDPPSKFPTNRPTALPTLRPTVHPTLRPTKIPTHFPTLPTKVPTPAPTSIPTKVPTKIPTIHPTKAPTPIPTAAPVPTQAPTSPPTKKPTAFPTTKKPTDAPTVAGALENQTSGSSKGMSNLEIVLMVLGLLILLFCVLVMVLFCIRERRKRAQMEVRSLQMEHQAKVGVSVATIPGVVDDSDELRQFCAQHKLEHHYQLFTNLGMTVPVLLASKEQDIRDFCTENKLAVSDRMKLLNAIAMQQVVEENMATMNQSSGENAGEDNEEHVAMAFGEMGRPPRNSTVVIGEDIVENEESGEKAPKRVSVAGLKAMAVKEKEKEKQKDFAGMLGDSAVAQGFVIDDIVEDMQGDAQAAQVFDIAAREDIEGDETK